MSVLRGLASRLSAAFGGGSSLPANFQRSPKASTLLREPLLRGSAQQVSVRMLRRGGSTTESADCGSFLRRGAESLQQLPREVWVVLLIDFLNSYRSFGFRSVQYQYMVNEFGLSDVETAYWLGVQSWLLVIFGMLGAVLVDAYGVRSTALASLSVAVVSRAVLTFGRSRHALLLALLGLAPFGEAVLSTGIYTVALKKLTTPATRGFAFGVQYGIFNFAGALADVAADLLRTHDFEAPRWLAPLVGGAAFSGLRVHLLGTWLAVLASLAVAIPYLHDVVILPLDEPSSPLCPDAAPSSISPSPSPSTSSPPASRFMEAGELERLRASATPQQLRQGFVVAPDPRRNRNPGRSAQTSPAPAPRRLVPRAWCDAATAAATRGWASLCELLRMRVFWRALWCSCCLLLISKQWGDLDQILPAYLERNYGEGVPIYRIHSINTWICMLGPSLAAALTSDLEAWSVMLPGLWVMAVSPLPLVLFPGVAATALWVGLMSLGEVIWSPRQSAWVAGLAPDGREGVFLALLSLKSLITTIPSTALNGYLNSAFVPNCPQCRDSHGHFCAAPRDLAPDEAAQGWLERGLGPAAHFACASEVEACVGTGFAEGLSAANLTGLQSCPESCAACPGWTGDGRTLWLIVLLTSLSSPVMVALTLNFLRGREATTAPAAAPAAAPADAARDVRLRGLTPLRVTRPLGGTSLH